MRTATLVAAIALVAAQSAAAQAPREINFGLISTESTQNLKQSWQPVLDDMARKTGYRINAFFASDYAGVIEGMRFNKVQVAWYGNKSAMEAVDRAQGEVFAQTVTDNGSEGYWSLLVVHRDSPLKSIDDVIRNAKTLSLGFGDPNSTSGFLVPGYYAFALNNIDPRTSFRAVRSANHEANLLAVANRQVDIATNNNESLDRLKMTNPQKAADVREIWRSPLIPSDPLVWRRDLDAEVKQKMRDFFLSYGKADAKERENLKPLGLSSFKPSDNRQLVPIRQLELFRDRQRIENDAALPPAEREKRLADIARRLQDLATQTAAAK